MYSIPMSKFSVLERQLSELNGAFDTHCTVVNNDDAVWDLIQMNDEL